jgi:ketosteroid isomerase-like protein
MESSSGQRDTAWAMSEENVELIRRFTEAVDRGDIDGAVAIANPPPEFEYQPPPRLPWPDLAGGVQRGPEGLRWTLEQFWVEFDGLHVELRELIDAGDRVFAAATVRGRGKHSGAETSWDVWGVWTVRGCRAVRWQGYTDRAAALEAAWIQE